MKEIWRGECSECEMAVEWVTSNIWMCGCPETGDETFSQDDVTRMIVEYNEG